MSSFYNYNAHQHPTAAHAQSAPSHHSGRGRRAPRVSQNVHRQLRAPARKEEETPAMKEYREHFAIARSFDLQDDMDFCPMLVTESDKVSRYDSSSSDRSSLSSGSPESSPQTYQAVPDTSFALNSSSASYMPSYQNTSLKLHQPAATRIRNAIPIVNPSTGMSMASPPQSVSPSRMQHLNRRW